MIRRFLNWLMPLPKHPRPRAYALGYADARRRAGYTDSIPPGHELRPFLYEYDNGWHDGLAANIRENRRA